MTIDELLSRLECVRPRGPGRWTARCPAHSPDKHPSLQVKEGEKATLLKCWTGCSLEQITEALQIPICDLFYDHHVDPRQWREQRRQQEAKRACQKREQQRQGGRIDTAREAERLIRAARGIDITTLSDVQLETILNRLGDAYSVLEGEQFDGTSGIL